MYVCVCICVRKFQAVSIACVIENQMIGRVLWKLCVFVHSVYICVCIYVCMYVCAYVYRCMYVCVCMCANSKQLLHLVLL